MAVARQVLYSGRVQGVGFRYTTRKLAEGFAVSGYVRNLPTGQVEVWVEGELAEVDDFLGALTLHMAGYIESQSVGEAAPNGLKGFSIRL